MKKILLLGAMLIGSLCMNAQTLLVAGNGGDDATGTWLGGKNWDTNVDPAANPNIMTDGTITLDAPAGTWAFKVVSVDAEGNASWFGVGAVDAENSSEGWTGTDNIQVTLPAPGQVTVSFDGEFITITGNFGELVIEAYTLVGDATIFGTADDPTNTANDMEDNGGGVYTKVYENVPLLIGEYRFKLVGNHSYAAYEFPGAFMDKTIVNLDADGLYNITITFDTNEADDSEYKLYAELEYVGELTAVEDAIANDEVVAAFDLTGKPVAADAKGVVILQYASGKAAKTVNY